jgi:colanic acid/amylovoran biosynthesis glycosyltransferase
MTSGRRHVGYVLKRFPRISETFVAAELIELRRQGERVTVFALSRPDEPFTHAFLAELDVRVVYLPRRPLGEPLRVATAVTRVVAADPRGWLRAAAVSLRPPRLRGWRRLLQATVLADGLARAGVTHVHAHFASTAARLANLAWRMGAADYSVTAHAKDIWHAEADADHLRDKLAHARFVATVSDANRCRLERLLGEAGKVRVVPNSVDPDRLPTPADRRPEPGRVLSVARLVEKKGMDDLVRACAQLARTGVAVRLEIIGDGPLHGELEALATTERAPVTFSGALPHEIVSKRYRHAAVFALPCVVAPTGDRDGLPTAVLEAMAAGVPVVATSVNGLADVVVDGRTGLVVPERNPAALAAALSRLLHDPGLGDRLADEAHALVIGRHTTARAAALLRRLFEEAA